MTNQIPTIILKPGKERALLRRHPWVYATGVSKVLGKPKSGETVSYTHLTLPTKA